MPAAGPGLPVFGDGNGDQSDVAVAQAVFAQARAARSRHTAGFQRRAVPDMPMRLTEALLLQAQALQFDDLDAATVATASQPALPAACRQRWPR